MTRSLALLGTENKRKAKDYRIAPHSFSNFFMKALMNSSTLRDEYNDRLYRNKHLPTKLCIHCWSKSLFDLISKLLKSKQSRTKKEWKSKQTFFRIFNRTGKKRKKIRFKKPKSKFNEFVFSTKTGLDLKNPLQSKFYMGQLKCKSDPFYIVTYLFWLPISNND